MSTPAPRENAVFLSDVVPERLRWLSPGRLAAGKLTILDGDPGLGKSTLLAQWIADLSQGRALPDGAPSRPRGAVLLSAEDGLGDTVRPRLEAADADLSRVVALLSVPDGSPEGRLPELPGDIPYLRQLVERVDAAILTIDPLMAYLGGSVNSWRDQDVRRALAPLVAMADETGVAVVAVRHLNKAQNAAAIYRGGGSIGIIGAARCGLLLAADPDDSERRVLASTKSNLARPPASIAFHLEPIPDGDVAVLNYLGVSNLSAGALLAEPADDEERTRLDEARDWLAELLAGGSVDQHEVVKVARRAGVSERTLRRAKTALGVESRRVGFGRGAAWVWMLPSGPIDGQSPGVAIYGRHAFEKARESGDFAIDGQTPQMATYATVGHLWSGANPEAPTPNGRVHSCLDCGELLSLGRSYRCAGCERRAVAAS